MRKHFTGFAFAIAIVSVAHWSFAVTYDVSIPDAQYGHLNQHDVGPNDDRPGHTTENNFCAPTATMNSFQMLQQRYPNVYGTPAQMQDGTGGWLQAAQELAGGEYMNTDPRSGTTERNWIDGKYDYLQHVAPGKTIFEGMDDLDQGNRAGFNVQNAAPTANFLLDMLQKGEDIEIGLSPTTGTGGIGHVITLTSINWNDADNSGTFNAGDTLTIDGIDPDTGAHFDAYPLSPADGSGYMHFTAGGGSPYAGQNYRLDAALAESPVPLPTSFYGGLALFVGLGCYFRFSSRQARAPLV